MNVRMQGSLAEAANECMKIAADEKNLRAAIAAQNCALVIRRMWQKENLLASPSNNGK